MLASPSTAWSRETQHNTTITNDLFVQPVAAAAFINPVKQLCCRVLPSFVRPNSCISFQILRYSRTSMDIHCFCPTCPLQNPVSAKHSANRVNIVQSSRRRYQKNQHLQHSSCSKKKTTDKMLKTKWFLSLLLRRSHPFVQAVSAWHCRPCLTTQPWSLSSPPKENATLRVFDVAREQTHKTSRCIEMQLTNHARSSACWEPQHTDKDFETAWFLSSKLSCCHYRILQDTTKWPLRLLITQ